MDELSNGILCFIVCSKMKSQEAEMSRMSDQLSALEQSDVSSRLFSATVLLAVSYLPRSEVWCSLRLTETSVILHLACNLIRAVLAVCQNAMSRACVVCTIL